MANVLNRHSKTLDKGLDTLGIVRFYGYFNCPSAVGTDIKITATNNS